MAPNSRRGGKPRGAGPTSRAASRGGIAKRSSGRPLPTDRDGDLDMDASGPAKPKRGSGPTTSTRGQPSTSSRRGGANKAGPTRASERVKNAVTRHLDGAGVESLKKKDVPLVWLNVKGLMDSKAAGNSGGGLRDLLSFIERKATTLTKDHLPVVIKQHRRNGELVEIGATRDDAEELIKVNNFTFAGAKLEITDCEGSLAAAREARASTEDLKAKLTNILASRYLVDDKLLKLDSLSQDQALVQMGFLESKERAEKMIAVMMKICDDLFKTHKDKMENIHSISLANNGITTIQQVDVVAETFPDLLNLDLSGNGFTKTTDLALWKGKFRKLTTLYIGNNPMNVNDLKARAELVRFFPKLKDINGEQLTPAQIEELRHFTKPRPIPQHGPDFRDTNGLGETFLVDLFALFDSDRLGLLAKYYDDESQFSLSLDSNAIRDMDSPAPMSWAAYLQRSRNLTRITTHHGRKSRLFVGREAILPIWEELPPTTHPDIKTDTSKYIMDCHLLPGLADPLGQSPAMDGMIILVHGQFEELDKPSGKRGLRSFSRSIVLGPGKPGSNNIRVVSDMFSLRAYNGLPNVLAAPAAPAVAPDEAQIRQAKIAELCKLTNMTPAYSEMCLVDCAWDYDRAVAVFNEKRSILPPDAFASS
ncbi:mRNA export factor mex67 [Plectosphaerella cucumerina]|uniref:mRNA export factor mex67 n=1 Tax=Plectosphaerella cucumerina TaxID=40658 RepID=A0A8K0TI15_9PEZI|nr:mRNA export factor mex67 [Plectosphaerella cucumerina]